MPELYFSKSDLEMLVTILGRAMDADGQLLLLNAPIVNDGTTARIRPFPPLTPMDGEQLRDLWLCARGSATFAHPDHTRQPR